MQEKQTRLQMVEALFKSRPNEWITCYELQAVGGFGGWRTRVDDCRDLGMDISSPPRYTRKPNGVILTEYRYVPPVPRTVQPDLFAEATA